MKAFADRPYHHPAAPSGGRWRIRSLARHTALAAALSGLLWVGGAGATGTETAQQDPLGQWLIDQGMLAHGGLAPEATPEAAPEATPAQDRLPASQLVVHAMGFLGVPYRWGGGSFEGGFDCSGFVQALYLQGWNVRLPRRAVEQAQATETIAREELQPGDLVFFNTLGARYSHVGLYIGEGRFIHSPRAGASIRMESMGASYWQRRFNGARRVVPDLLARANGPTDQ